MEVSSNENTITLALVVNGRRGVIKLPVVWDEPAPPAPAVPDEPTRPRPDTVTPPVDRPQPQPAPVAGSPRRLVGDLDGHPLYLALFGAESVLIQVLSNDPDTFVPRGFEVNYAPLDGTTKLTGPWTGSWGYNPPANFKTPDGYVAKEFPKANGGGTYYERSPLIFQHYDDAVR